MVRLLQLTDTHIFADAQKELYGVNPRRSLNAVVNDIVKNAMRFDAVLLTGDLVHDEGDQAYRELLAIVSRLQAPVYCLPGNHDYPDAMREVFENVTDEGILAWRLNNWQMVMLDSSIPGKVEGRLSEVVLRKLRGTLVQAGGAPVFIALHHHAVNVGSQWMDNLNLTNHKEFRRLLADFPNVKVVLNGHIHQELDLTLNQVRYLGSPSTCFQFKAAQPQAGIDTLPPAYRYIELQEDGNIATQVSYLGDAWDSEQRQ